MLEFNGDITDFFFQEIKKKGKYTLEKIGSKIVIIPREEEPYYKPIIQINDIERLKIELQNYRTTLLNFYNSQNCFADYQDLSYFFNNILFGMTNSDATDLESYINKKNQFFYHDPFVFLDKEKKIYQKDNVSIFVKRHQELPGYESPYIITFHLELNKTTYYLPLIKYAVDQNKICNLFTIQFGRNRINKVQDDDYKSTINIMNKGIKKYRNVSPSFVLSLRLFLDLLKEVQINKIVVPDFLFCKYRNYYKSRTVTKSDNILERILNEFLILLKRMEYQFPDFKIENYPNEIDSYTHIKIDTPKKKRELL